MGDDTCSTRRRLLQAFGGAAFAGVAGCLGDSGSGTTSTPTEGSMDDSMGTETTGDSADVQTMDESTDAETMGDSMDTETTGDSMDNETMDESTNTETMGDSMGTATTFSVTVENVSTGSTLGTMDGSAAVPLSPGVYAVTTGTAGLFAPGEAASDGLEALAEDGTPGGLAEEVAGREGVLDGGVFDTPQGTSEPGPLSPGGRYAFEVEAAPDADPALSLATMFVQSNDLFYAPDPEGVALFEGGEPVAGEVTAELSLWDAGTEENQPPGDGPDQAPRQSSPDTGPGEDAAVRRLSAVEDGHDYPAVEDVIRVTVSTA